MDQNGLAISCMPVTLAVWNSFWCSGPPLPSCILSAVVCKGGRVIWQKFIITDDQDQKHFTYKKLVLELVGAGALLITLIFSYVGCKPWADIWVLNCSTVGI